MLGQASLNIILVLVSKHPDSGQAVLDRTRTQMLVAGIEPATRRV